MAESSYTYTITPEQGEILKQILEEKDFTFSPLAYGHFAAKKGKCGVQYYQSGKLLVQGKDCREFIEFELEPRVLQKASLGYEEVLNPEMYEPHFGIDESGKGDFFGPLVIAGAYVDRSLAHKLIELGVKDSKKIQSDKKAIDLAEAIQELLGKKFYNIVTIGPEKYNEIYGRLRNLNTLLAWGHGKVIENLHRMVPNCPRALSDQFANPRLIQTELYKKKITIKLEQRTKAEADIAVAAASILARAEFLKRLEALGKLIDVNLGKGASSLVREQGIEIAKKHGLAKLQNVCKQHFKTFTEIENLIKESQGDSFL